MSKVTVETSTRGAWRFVAKAGMIDPQKLGVMVARNFGAIADAFTSEADAVAWLHGGD
jgi:hypothetical protein